MPAGTRKALRVWVQGPMRRIFPHDEPPPGARRTIALSAARGECECFQAGVRAEGFAANYLVAEPTALRGPEGARLPARCVEVFYPEYVPARWQAANQRRGDVERPAPGFFPDPLLPSWTFDVAGPGAPPARSVWVRVTIPRNAKPGIYRGEIALRAGWRNLKAENQTAKPAVERTAAVRFAVRVWPFAIPARPKFLSTYWFWPAQAARWHGMAMWSPEFWSLLDRVASDMQAHRQNVIFTPLIGALSFVSGASSMKFFTERPEDQMIGVRRRGRRYVFGFSRLDRWCRTFFRRGFRLVEGEHVTIGVAQGLPFWERGRGGKFVRRSWKASDPRYEDFLAQLMEALWKHLGKRGWRSKWVQHIADEPGADQAEAYARVAAIVSRAAPGIEKLDAIGDPVYGKLIEHPVPVEHHYEKVLRASGLPREAVWVYYCCAPTGPWPNRFLEYPPVRLRILPWLFFRKGIPAVLHWGYNFWGGFKKESLNPWDDTTGNRWPAGDPMVVYPPRNPSMHGTITGSIRWELTREAMEDYEYLCMCKDLAERGNAAAKRLLREVERRVAPDWTTHTRDEAYLMNVRERMGRLLAKAYGR